MKRKLSVEIWSDVVCPWCYIGKRRFEQALAAFEHRDDVHVVWRSFELNPTAPRDGEGQGGYVERLAAKYGASITEAQAMVDRVTGNAAAEGLVFDLSIARPGNTFDAHRLLHHASELGLQGVLKERLLRAYFAEGEPISSPETLVRLACDVGVPEEAARAVTLGDAYAAEVRADEARARSLQITGVPFFLFEERYGVSGAQPPDVLLNALQRAWSDAQGSESVAQPRG